MPGGMHPPLSVMASWPTPNYTNPQTHGPGFSIIVTILIVLAFVAVGGRVWARAVIQGTAALDDWLMLAALVPTLGLVITTSIAVNKYGFDRHVWDNPYSNFVMQRKLNLIAETFFVLASTLIKLSVLLFYRRIATRAVSKVFIAVMQATAVSVILFAIAFLSIPFLTCRPFAAYWEQLDPAKIMAGYKYHCLNEPAHLISAACISTAQDLLTTTLPAVLCWRLQLPKRQKIALAAIFATGYVVCVIGMLRIYATWRVFLGSYDTTWNTWYAWLVSSLEVLIALIIASLPALRVFFNYYADSVGSGHSKKSGSGKRSVGARFASWNLLGRIKRRAKARGGEKGSGDEWMAATGLESDDTKTGDTVPLTATASTRSAPMDLRQDRRFVHGASTGSGTAFGAEHLSTLPPPPPPALSGSNV